MAGNKNSGRRASEVTVRCQTIMQNSKLFDVLAKIARAEIEEEFVTKDGETISSPTKNSDRIAAIKLLASYAYGQPAQAVDVTSGGKPLLLLGSPV
jgi:hypothetical protein